MSEGRVEAIWVKRAKHGPMESMTEVTTIAGRGIRENAEQGGRRQVTIMDAEAWEGLRRELGGTLPPSARRANLLVRGVALKDSQGKVLRIGDCRVRILGETKPCQRMDHALPGLRQAMASDWRGGAFGEVLVDGLVRVGDSVRWEETVALESGERV